MPRLYLFLRFFLLAALVSAFHNHHYGKLGSSKSCKICSQKGTSGPFCRRTIQEREEICSTGLLPFSRYMTAETPSPSTEPSNCSSKHNMNQIAGRETELPVGRLMDFLCCELFVLLCDPLPVAAKSAAASYSENYGYWGNFGYLIAPGLPMLVTVIGFIVLSNSFKAELKSDMGLLETKLEIIIDSLKSEMKSDIVNVKSEMKADIGTLGSKIDALTASIGGRLDIQDKNIELAVRELKLQERENNMKNK
jgi:hypothetical protein